MSPRVSVRQAIAAALFCALPLSFQSHAGVGIGAIPVPQDVQSDRLIIRFKDNIPFDKVNEVLKRVEYNEVCWIQSDRNYADIYLENRRYSAKISHNFSIIFENFFLVFFNSIFEAFVIVFC